MYLSGAQEVKRHPFYQTLHWDELIMHKAEFVPYLDSEEDTSYFDCKFLGWDTQFSNLVIKIKEELSSFIQTSITWHVSKIFIRRMEL